MKKSKYSKQRFTVNAVIWTIVFIMLAGFLFLSWAVLELIVQVMHTIKG